MGLGKLLKKAARGAIKVAAGAAGIATGGLATTAIGLGAQLIGGKKGPGTAMANLPAYNPPGIQLPGGVSLDFPGMGRPGYGIMATGGRRGRVQAGPRGECPRGYHLNKAASADGTPAKSFCVRNRHVNYANGRAASRAGRRVRGTVRLLRRSFTLVAAKPPKGKWIPKGRGSK